MMTISSAPRRLIRFSLPASLILIGACATEPDNTRFGESVRHMISLQTTDPNANASGIDGPKASAALRAYRTDVAKPKTVDTKSVGVGVSLQ
jgi:hypothetical protein